MTTGDIGGDIGYMQSLRDRFNSEAENVMGLKSRLDAAFDPTKWRGQAAEKFHQEWVDIHGKNLSSLASTLSESARVVQARIAALEAASRG